MTITELLESTKELAVNMADFAINDMEKQTHSAHSELATALTRVIEAKKNLDFYVLIMDNYYKAVERGEAR
jgi:hypothetical protein